MKGKRMANGYNGVEPYATGRATKTEQIEAGQQREEINCGMTKTVAIGRGRTLLQTMEGRGWCLRVWQNLGWHYSVHRGTLSIRATWPTNGRPTYWTMMGYEDGSGMPLFDCPGNPHYGDPNAAVRAQLRYAKRQLANLQQTMTSAMASAEGGR